MFQVHRFTLGKQTKLFPSSHLRIISKPISTRPIFLMKYLTSKSSTNVGLNNLLPEHTRRKNYLKFFRPITFKFTKITNETKTLFYPDSENQENSETSFELFPDEDCEEIQTLLKSDTVQNIFETIDNLGNNLNVKHAAQSIATLTFLHKCSTLLTVNRYFPLSMSYFLFPEFILKDPIFNKLIDCINKSYDELELYPIIIMLLQLDRGGVDKSKFPKEKMLKKVLDRRNELTINELIYFTLFLKNQNYKSYLPTSLVVNRLVELLKNVDDGKDLCRCIKAFSHMNQFVTVDTLKLIRDKVLFLVNKNSFFEHKNNDVITILKIFHFNASFAPNYLLNSILFQLMYYVDTSNLDYNQVCIMRQFFNSHFEPRTVIRKINQRGAELLECIDDKSAKIRLKLGFRHGYVDMSKEEYDEILNLCLQDEIALDIISNTTVYYALKNFKFKNVEVCDKFWESWSENIKHFENVRSDIYKSNFTKKYSLLHSTCLKYLNFTIDSNFSYRNRKFEVDMLTLFKNKLCSNEFIPFSEFIAISGFYIAFCNCDDLFLETLSMKIKKVSPQFNVKQVSELSRCINVSYNLSGNFRNNTWYKNNMNEISKVLRNVMDNLLLKNLNLEEIIWLMECYSNMKILSNNAKLNLLFEKIIDLKHNFSAKEINVLSNILLQNHIYDSRIFHIITLYAVKNEPHISIFTVQKIMKLISFVSSPPKMNKQLLDVCVNVIQSDGNYLQPHRLMTCCFALAIHMNLNSTIVRSIFRISFLDHLEDFLIRSCNEKFSKMVRYNLMELNRAICLDYPEENVPWFHQKFCEDHIDDYLIKNDDAFHSDVHKSLSSLLGRSRLKTFSKSPYFYILGKFRYKKFFILKIFSFFLCVKCLKYRIWQRTRFLIIPLIFSLQND